MKARLPTFPFPPAGIEAPSPSPVARRPDLPAPVVAQDREVKVQRIDAPPAAGEEIPVFTFEKRWRACDVYVLPSASILGVQGIARVKIYAISGGARALVASGVYAPGQATIEEFVYIAGARAACERYEVTLQLFGNLVTPDDVAVVAVGTNEAVALPPQVGVARLHNIPLGASAAMPGAGAASNAAAQFEVVGVIATNVSAATRFLQLHDRFTVAAAAGQAPRYSFAMPAGASINLRHDLGRFSRSGLVVFVSSNGFLADAAGVVAGDVIYEVLGR